MDACFVNWPETIEDTPQPLLEAGELASSHLNSELAVCLIGLPCTGRKIILDSLLVLVSQEYPPVSGRESGAPSLYCSWMGGKMCFCFVLLGLQIKLKTKTQRWT